MKSKKLCHRESIYVFKSYTGRCGVLCTVLMMCFTLTVFREGNLLDFFLDNPWRIAILGEPGWRPSQQDTFWCDRLSSKTDVCRLRGEVHVVTGNSSGVILHSRSKIRNCDERVEMIRPYTRKWENQTMASVQPVELKCRIIDDLSLPFPNGNNFDSSCDMKHSVPAVLFSCAGFTGNPYHDFQDVIIPLFISSQHLKGEVVFIVSDIRLWWVRRWNRVLQQLSHHPIVDFSEHTGDHCFPDVMVGLYTHKELSLNPSRMPNGETIQDFQLMLHNALAYPLAASSQRSFKIPDKVSRRQHKASRKVKLLIIARKGTRALLNEEEVVNLAKELKYQVKVVTLSDKIDLQVIYGWFHESDVVMAVHGAELAHMMFMRRKTVVVQIVPLGTDWPSDHYYGRPAVVDLGLHYIEYKIKPEESSLSEKYGLWHPIVRNPSEYVARGWATQKRLYLTEQNVTLSTTTLRRSLQTARSSVLFAFPLRVTPFHRQI